MTSSIQSLQSPISPPLSHVNLGERVYQLLWNRIINRELHPDEKLSDVHLSAELGVSRTPVREALNRLVQDGIVRAEPRHGFYVQSFSARDITEIYDLRQTLEVMALRIAASHLTANELERSLADLDEAESMLREADTNEDIIEIATHFLEKDRAFHRLIVERAGNARLATILEGLWAQIAVFQKAGIYRRGWTLTSIAYHRQIITALLDGNSESACVAMARHMTALKRRVLDDLGTDRPVAHSV